MLQLAGFHIAAQDIHMTSNQGGAGTILGIDFDHDGHNDFEIQLNKMALGTLSVADIICKARYKNGPFPGLKRGQSLQTKSLD